MLYHVFYDYDVIAPIFSHRKISYPLGYLATAIAGVEERKHYSGPSHNYQSRLS